MAYDFSGFFVAPVVDVREVVASIWPSAISVVFRPGDYFKPTHLPPGGILGVTLPTEDTVGNRDLGGSDPEFFYRSILCHLPAMSRTLSSSHFAALLVHCHGGPDEAAGAVFVNGQCLWEASAHTDQYDEVITECMRRIGVGLTDAYFPPLERGAFARLGLDLELTS